jgi:hypothetical protein
MMAQMSLAADSSAFTYDAAAAAAAAAVVLSWLK